MKYAAILFALSLTACKKKQCYECTTHYHTQSVAAPPGEQILCDMTEEQIEAHEKAGTSHINGMSTETHCRIK